MTEEDALIASIRSNPFDDLRLKFHPSGCFDRMSR